MGNQKRDERNSGEPEAGKVDRRIRKTRAQLRAGLAALMQKKSIKEITVRELVEEVDINRSTFYLHYTDIYQMLESIENELMAEIRETIQSYRLTLGRQEEAYSFGLQFFTILAENRDICAALMGPNGDLAFVERIEKLIGDSVLPGLFDRFPQNIEDIEYAYDFCINGCVGLVRRWLTTGPEETPEHMALLTHQLVSVTSGGYIRKRQLETRTQKTV